ncbi:MAG: sulfur carrier protein ThiS [Chloroflexi bacterium]|nr:sulfur carrier protein ThiS [Chloroflexota bacterium]
MIALTINGKERTLPAETPLPDYLAQIGVNPLAVAVEHNGDVIHRERYADVILRAGDRVEILRMIGGG